MNETYDIQGYTFELVDRTQANIETVTSRVEENNRKRQKIFEFAQDYIEEEVDFAADGVDISELRDDAIKAAEEELGFSEAAGEWEIRREIFRMALDGPHEQIDEDKLTWDRLEQVRKDFIPAPMRLLDAPTAS